ATLAARWPAITSCSDALTWLEIQIDLGLSPRIIDAYARAMTDYLTVCRRDAIDPLIAGRSEIARYVRDLRQGEPPRYRDHHARLGCWLGQRKAAAAAGGGAPL